MRTFFRGIGVMVLLAGFAIRVQACALPVFRYALEHWPSSPSDVVVLQQGQPTPEQRTLSDVLGQSHCGFTGIFEVGMKTHVADGPTPREIWNDMGQPLLPVMVLRRWPGGAYAPALTCQVPFRKEYVQQLVKSPERRELVQRLLGGDSIVWVLLTSGDASKDKAAKTLLETTLRQTEMEQKLPADQDAVDTKYDPPPAASIGLKLHFSVLEVSGRGLEADLLRGMLQPLATNLTTAVGPVVFPVFGRARALAVFWGGSLTAENIKETCVFLCSDCSCIVKEAQPGVELFVYSDWDGILSNTTSAPEPLPPLEVPVAKAPSAETVLRVGVVAPPTNIAPPQAVVPEPALKTVKSKNAPLNLSKSLGIALGIGLLAMILGTIWVFRRTERK